jgi:DNA-binding response OmpR family regulator
MGKKILVVDDDKSLRSLYRIELESEGYRVLLAGDGNEASAWVAQEMPDVIVMDIRMPGKDGFTILHDLRSRGVRTPVICLTARDAVADRVRGLDLGADGEDGWGNKGPGGTIFGKGGG